MELVFLLKFHECILCLSQSKRKKVYIFFSKGVSLVQFFLVWKKSNFTQEWAALVERSEQSSTAQRNYIFVEKQFFTFKSFGVSRWDMILSLQNSFVSFSRCSSCELLLNHPAAANILVVLKKVFNRASHRKWMKNNFHFQQWKVLPLLLAALSLLSSLLGAIKMF